MASVYTRKGNYKDPGALWLNALGVAMIVGGLGFMLVWLMDTIDETISRDLAFHPPVYLGYIMFFLGCYSCKAANLRAHHGHGKEIMFRVKPVGVMLVILQVLMIADMILNKNFEFSKGLLRFTPAIYAIPIFLGVCRKKSMTLSIFLIVHAVAILLLNIQHVLHEIPGQGLQVIFITVPFFLGAFVLLHRRKEYSNTDQEDLF